MMVSILSPILILGYVPQPLHFAAFSDIGKP